MAASQHDFAELSAHYPFLDPLERRLIRENWRCERNSIVTRYCIADMGFWLDFLSL
jgi:hypothetical protein